jgi:DNA-binding transcriptional MerR regulator
MSRSSNSEPDAAARTYRSGAAARLAGLPVETLRVWERRYGVVNPAASEGGQRRYSPADVQRLAHVKRLVDAGHPIGVVARLSDDELADMRGLERPAHMRTDAADPTLATPSVGTRVRVAVVSPVLAAMQSFATAEPGELALVARCDDIRRAPEVLAGIAADLVVIEFVHLWESDLPRIAEIVACCGGAQAIVLYRFAPSAVVRCVRAAGHAVARSSSDPTDIEMLCRNVIRQSRSPAFDGHPAPPRFDDVTLGALLAAPPSLACECPQHLAELVMALGGFERYSAQCASRNTEDMALHLELQREVGFARAFVERALERVAIAEGFALDATAAHSRPQGTSA